MRYLPLILGLSLLAPTLGAEPQAYTMADVRALAKGEAWTELLDNAQRVRPKDRPPEWQKLVTRAARAVIKAPSLATDPLQVLTFTEKHVRKYPFLKKQADYMKKRSAEGLKAFDECFRSGRRWRHSKEVCRSALLRFVRVDQTNGAGAHAAGDLVARQMGAYYALPFYHQAIVQLKLRGKCRQPSVKKAILSSLSLPPKHAEEVKMAKALFFGACFDATKRAVIAALASDANTRVNTCIPLLKKGVLRGVRAKKCRRLR